MFVLVSRQTIQVLKTGNQSRLGLSNGVLQKKGPYRSNVRQVQDVAQNRNSPENINNANHFHIIVLALPEEVDGHREETTEEDDKPVKLYTHALGKFVS